MITIKNTSTVLHTVDVFLTRIMSLLYIHNTIFNSFLSEQLDLQNTIKMTKTSKEKSYLLVTLHKTKKGKK